MISEDDIDAFYVDIVGLPVSEFTEIKSDGELFDFDGEVENGLLIEDRSLQANGGPSYSWVKSMQKHFHSDSQCTSQNGKLEKLRTPKGIRKKRNKQVWNDIEKDLFEKGLEMFGQNWRKISQFVATKTARQVESYYKLWGETTNGILDSKHSSVANDKSPFSLSDSPGVTDDFSLYLTEHHYNSSDNPSSSNTSSMDKQHRMLLFLDNDNKDNKLSTVGSQMVLGSEWVVSSLNDWNLGSQVSVVEEVTPHSVLNLNRRMEKVKSENTKLNKKKMIFQKKVLKNYKKVTNSKKYVKQKCKKKGNHDELVKPQLGGQIIHIRKDNVEDADVDVDCDSESKVIAPFSPDKVIPPSSPDKVIPPFSPDKGNSKICQKNEAGTNSNTSESSNLLTESEKEFCENYADKMSILNFIQIRDHVLQLNSVPKISRSHVESCSKILNIDKECVSLVVKFLEVTGLIGLKVGDFNPDSKRYSRRSRREIGIMRKQKVSLEMREKFGGGVTMSHDATGAVIDAFHIPEDHAQHRTKKPNMGQNLKLQNCFHYEQDNPAPFSVVIQPLAFIALDIHAHSSLSEVMGLLGGFLDSASKTLYITKAIPTKALSSDLECDMCPLAQKEASDFIQEAGDEVVGWYHSHPHFLPFPSERDVETQGQMQSWFTQKNSPFVGLIISPFCPSAPSEASLLRVIILDKLVGKRCVKGVDVEVPFYLHWKLFDELDPNPEAIEQAIRDTVNKSDSLQSFSDKIFNRLESSLQAHIPQLMKFVYPVIKKFIKVR